MKKLLTIFVCLSKNAGFLYIKISGSNQNGRSIQVCCIRLPWFLTADGIGLHFSDGQSHNSIDSCDIYLDSLRKTVESSKGMAPSSWTRNSMAVFSKRTYRLRGPKWIGTFTISILWIITVSINEQSHTKIKWANWNEEDFLEWCGTTTSRAKGCCSRFQNIPPSKNYAIKTENQLSAYGRIRMKQTSRPTIVNKVCKYTGFNLRARVLSAK